MPKTMCPRCGQMQIRLDPVAGCVFCGRGTTQIYAPRDGARTASARTEPIISPTPTAPIGTSAMLRFTTLFAAAQTLHAQANMTRAANTGEEANLIDATLVQVLAPAVKDVEGDSGWLHAARIVLDIATTTQLDALVAPAWSRAAVRMAALVMVPDLEHLTSSDMAHQRIDTAIHIGAPAFNAGDVRHCATVYWVTALTLVEAPVRQRNPRLGRVLAPLRQAIDAPQPPIGDDERALKDYAWHLRRALDEALHAA